MSKPRVYIIQKAFLQKNQHPKLPGSFKIATTVGLIEYEKDGQKKYMVIDSCQTVNWTVIEKGINEIAGGMNNVTHLLLTHLHKDHIQNIGQFNGKILFLANKTTLLGEHEYGSQEIYSDGHIEIPEIQYEIVNDAHSHDDTVYIIDSANEGKVAFIGDLIYMRLSKMPIETVISMEKRASVDPVKKYLYIKDFIKKYPDVQKVYCGHDDEALTQEDLKQYVEALDNSQEWKDYLIGFVKDKGEELNKYVRELK